MESPVNSSKSTTIVLSPESRFFGPGRGREKAVSPRARIAIELPTSNAVNVPLNMPACAEQSNRQRCSGAHQIRKEQHNHIGSDDHRMICHEHGEWAGQDADRIGQDMRCCVCTSSDWGRSGRAPELVAPLSESRSGPRVTEANAGDASSWSVKPR